MRYRWRMLIARVLFILAILGPGFITANVDNDAGGIYTYASAGAQFGYSLLWTMIPVAICLTFAQEIAARMGVVTGKGFSELIREEYGIRITFFLMLGLVLCNLGDVISEFAGVASSMQLFSVSKYISVPIALVLVWSLVVFGDYKKLERISSGCRSCISPTSSRRCWPSRTGWTPRKRCFSCRTCATT